MDDDILEAHRLGIPDTRGQLKEYALSEGVIQKCDFCQEVIKDEEEKGQISARDESADLCESCYEHYCA